MHIIIIRSFHKAQNKSNLVTKQSSSITSMTISCCLLNVSTRAGYHCVLLYFSYFDKSWISKVPVAFQIFQGELDISDSSCISDALTRMNISLPCFILDGLT